ncbi:MAG TPA: hypothetical protein VM737_01980 [Gemmatimonadota bacterium]|nr:hypothetical protein [Gemmatimonadota bacterium]
MRLDRRFTVFLLLTLSLVALAAAWSVYRHRSHATEREAWRVITAEIGTGRGRIDSLESVLARLDARVEEEKDRLAGAAARISHYEGQSVRGRLPTPAYREYLASIDRHNRVVESYNAALVEQRRVYADYSILIDAFNARVDSANQLQRTAVEQGIQLPPLLPDGL